MTTQKELVAVLKRYRGTRKVIDVVGDASMLLLRAKRYAQIQERWCNEEMDDATREAVERREKKLETDIAATVAHYAGARVEFGGDPRGFTVKLHLPPIDGRKPHNSWGGEECGFGIG